MKQKTFNISIKSRRCAYAFINTVLFSCLIFPMFGYAAASEADFESTRCEYLCSEYKRLDAKYKRSNATNSNPLISSVMTDA